MFKWGDNPNISKIKYEINRLRINSDKQREGLRQCLGNGIPLDIRKPSYKSCMAALRTEIHIVRLKLYPTGAIRHCLKCDDEINNTLHNFYHCPVATFMWDIARDTIKILLEVSIKFYMRAVIIIFYVMKDRKLDKNEIVLINTIMLITRRVLYTIFYREDETVRYSITRRSGCYAPILLAPLEG